MPGSITLVGGDPGTPFSLTCIDVSSLTPSFSPSPIQNTYLLFGINSCWQIDVAATNGRECRKHALAISTISGHLYGPTYSIPDDISIKCCIQRLLAVRNSRHTKLKFAVVLVEDSLVVLLVLVPVVERTDEHEQDKTTREFLLLIIELSKSCCAVHLCA